MIQDTAHKRHIGMAAFSSKSGSYDLEKRRSNKPQSERTARTVAIEFAVVFSMFIGYLCITTGLQSAIAYYTCDQTDILAPYRPNSIPTLHMIVIGNLMPVLAICICEAFNSIQLKKLLYPDCDRETSKNRSTSEAVASVSSSGFRHYSSHAINLFWLGQFTVVLITEVGKRWTGRLRPNFLDVCRPNLDALVCFNRSGDLKMYNSIYTGGDFCTGDPDKVQEARLSFPSGHASFTTYCALYLIVYLEMRLFVTRLHFPKRLLQCLLLLVVTMVLLSRYSDFQHHATDILAGFVLGLAGVIMATYVGSFIWFAPTALHSPHNYLVHSKRNYLSINNEDYRESSSEKLVF